MAAWRAGCSMNLFMQGIIIKYIGEKISMRILVSLFYINQVKRRGGEAPASQRANLCCDKFLP